MKRRLLAAGCDEEPTARAKTTASSKIHKIAAFGKMPNGDVYVVTIYGCNNFVWTPERWRERGNRRPPSPAAKCTCLFAEIFLTQFCASISAAACSVFRQQNPNSAASFCVPRGTREKV